MLSEPTSIRIIHNVVISHDSDSDGDNFIGDNKDQGVDKHKNSNIDLMTLIEEEGYGFTIVTLN
jgi:hypothetical protein